MSNGFSVTRTRRNENPEVVVTLFPPRDNNRSTTKRAGRENILLSKPVRAKRDANLVGSSVDLVYLVAAFQVRVTVAPSIFGRATCPLPLNSHHDSRTADHTTFVSPRSDFRDTPAARVLNHRSATDLRVRSRPGSSVRSFADSATRPTVSETGRVRVRSVGANDRRYTRMTNSASRTRKRLRIHSNGSRHLRTSNTASVGVFRIFVHANISPSFHARNVVASPTGLTANNFRPPRTTPLGPGADDLIARVQRPRW